MKLNLFIVAWKSRTSGKRGVMAVETRRPIAERRLKLLRNSGDGIVAWMQKKSIRIKAAAGLLMLFPTLLVRPADTGLAFDPSPTSGVTNYVMYSAVGTAPLGNPVNLGTNTALTFTFTTNGIFRFAFTAMKGGLESDLSSILTLDVPKPPANLRTVVLQVNANLSSGAWTNIGFFRVQILP